MDQSNIEFGITDASSFFSFWLDPKSYTVVLVLKKSDASELANYANTGFTAFYTTYFCRGTTALGGTLDRCIFYCVLG